MGGLKKLFQLGKIYHKQIYLEVVNFSPIEIS